MRKVRHIIAAVGLSVALSAALFSISIGGVQAFGFGGIGGVVIDPTNLVQNTVTAAKAVRTEINTTATAIQSLRAAIATARSLTSVSGLAKLAGLEEELSMYREISMAAGQIKDLINKSERLARSVQGDFGASKLNWKEFLESRAALRVGQADSLLAQYSNLNSSLAQVAKRRQEYVAKLQAAGGQTEAMQIVGSAVDTLVGQNQQMIATLQAQGNAQIARENVDDAARQMAERLIQERQSELKAAAERFNSK